MIISEEDYIAHFGVRGMHWGIRKGKKTTGVSRMRGMMLDRNARSVNNLQSMYSGKTGKRSAAMGKRLLGEAKWKENMNKSITNLNQQSDRLKAGKLLKSDRLDMAMHVRAFMGVGLVLSRTPTKA
jgi:hypothetical protein